MTITTEEPPAAELTLREGESGTGPGWCAMCGRTPCELAGAAAGSRFRAEQLCYRFRPQPQPLPLWARDAAHHVLYDLDLRGRSEQWPPGTGDVLRALAEELTYWADRADQAVLRREAGE